MRGLYIGFIKPFKSISGSADIIWEVMISVPSRGFGEKENKEKIIH